MTYLRVKNWRKHQHYAKRRPPWIKFYNDLIDDDTFEELDELEQWQLVRIWLIASRSTRFAPDEEGVPVPVVPRDEATLRRAIKSLKRIPVRKLEDVGFLIPVDDNTVVVASKTSVIPDLVASSLASTDASALLTRARARAGATENQREREPREAEANAFPPLALARSQPLNRGTDSSTIGKLRKACRVVEDSEDDAKLQRAAHGLAEIHLVDVAYAVQHSDVRDRLAFALAALAKRKVPA